MPIARITDPLRTVTDQLVLNHIDALGLDKNYVEFYGDYQRDGIITPYCKFYRNLLSNQQIVVASGLPMRRKTDGRKLNINWIKQDSLFVNDVNLFNVMVDGIQIHTVVLNDQPSGEKALDSMTYAPRLFINGAEKLPVSTIPAILAIDPMNGRLSHNTLEWDYGVCKRRVRVIQGRIREKWYFTEDPGGDVRIQHNKTGDLKLRLGRISTGSDDIPTPIAVIEGDEEFVSGIDMAAAVYPVVIGASPGTFYPDTNGAGVDGRVGSGAAERTWANMIAAAGGASDDSTGIMTCMNWAGLNLNTYWLMFRGIFVIDVSDVPSAATVTNTVFSIYGTSKQDDESKTPNLNVYLSAPASDTSLVDGDFDSFGATAYCDTPITYAGYNTSGYNAFTFNANPGIVAVQAAVDASDVVKLGTRNPSYDVSGTPPGTAGGGFPASKLSCEYVENAGNKPKLVVTYTLGSVPPLMDYYRRRRT